MAPALAFQKNSAPNVDNPSTLEDFKAGDAAADGERYQRASDVLKALEVSRGDWVADVGAGAGYYSMRLSDLVGPTGKVFADDMSDDSMRWLLQRVKVFDLRNVEAVNAAMDERILRMLKPGGRLVVADYSLPAHRSQSRDEQVKIHEIDPALVREELTRAGFHVVSCEDPYVKRKPEADMWLIVAARF